MRKTKKIRIQQEMRVSKAFEPSWESTEVCPTSVVIRTICWYHENKNEKDAAKYLKCDVSNAKDNLTHAWVSRMLARGFIFGEKEMNTIREMENKFASFVEENKVQRTKASTTNVVDIQDRLNNKVNEYIGELEGFIDDYGVNGSVKDCNPYQWMVDNEVKAIYSKKIADHFRSNLQLFESDVLLSKEESDEAYSGYSKKRLNNIVEVYNKIIEDAERIGTNQKGARKPRKPRMKKAVPVEKIVSRLKYKLRDDSFKIQSIDATKIIGASQLWVFNTKTRKLGLYVAADLSGLSIKGSTILNYSEASVEKTIRKPEEILPKVVTGGKVLLRKLLSDVRAKERELTGRINKEVVLLRVT